MRMRGEYGYTRYIKRHNYKWAIILLFICLTIFFLGKSLFSNNEPPFMVASALMVLPFAQFLAKAISFSGYRPLEEEKFKRLEAVSEHFLVLGELPIIRGKKTYFFQCIIITDIGVYALIPKNSVPLQSKKIVESIIQPKGHQEPVYIYRDYEKLYLELKHKIKAKAQTADTSKMQRLADALIIKAH